MENEGLPLFVLDAGNLFFKRDNLPQGVALDKAKINADIILKSFNVMGCDGITLGSRDFCGGLDYVLSLKNNANFPFISANILDTFGSKLFKPYKIISKGGVSIGVIGLASVFNHPDLLVEDPIETLNSIVYEIEPQADMIILLFNATESDIAKVRDSDLPIDLIIQSKARKRSNDGGNYNIPIFSCGDRGKYLYQFDVQIDQPGRKIVDLSSQKKALSSFEQQLSQFQHGDQSVKLNSDDPDEKIVLNKIEKIKSNRDDVRNTIERATNSITFTRIDMGKKVANRPDIHEIVQNGKNLAKIKKTVPDSEPAIPFTQPKSKKENDHRL